MKRSDLPITTTNQSKTTTLRGYGIGVSNITKNENNSNNHYTLTMEGPDASVLTIMRYLKINSTCPLYSQLQTFVNNQHGIELTQVKCNTSSYTITDESHLVEKQLTFNPQWDIADDISNLKMFAEEKLCAIECKILHIAPPQSFIITSGFKRTQKLRKEIIIGDKTAAINLNIYEMHFNSIAIGMSYKISAVKTRLFKNVISLAAISETKFTVIDQLLNVSTDTSLLGASLKKINGCIMHIEPDMSHSTNNTTIFSYKMEIQTSATEQYWLTVTRDCLLQFLNLSDNDHDITEDMLSKIVKEQNLIGAQINCTFEKDSGTIKEIERERCILPFSKKY